MFPAEVLAAYVVAALVVVVARAPTTSSPSAGVWDGVARRRTAGGRARD